MAKANPLSKQLALGLIVFAIIILVLANKEKSKVNMESVYQTEQQESAIGEDAINEGIEIKTIESEVEGDTVTDTITTLTAELEMLQKEQNKRESQEIKYLEENKKLKQELDKNTKQSNKALEKYDELVAKITGLENNLDNISLTKPAVNPSNDRFSYGDELPINGQSGGGGLPQIKSPNFNSTIPVSNGNKLNINTDDEIVWIKPIDSQETFLEDGSVSFEVPDISIRKTIENSELYREVADTDYGRSVGMEQEKSESIAFATIPRGGTSVDGISLTALIGRIPFGGAVVDPYRFKVLISAENLASNGIVIDGLANAIVGGRATGDYVLQCVDGQIDFITFTFEDGTISTFPENDQENSAMSLGYISDKAGVPCVSGQYISNDSTYLTQQVGISALATGASAYARDGITTTTTTEGSTSTVTDPDQYAIGEMISSGVNTTSEFLSERQQNAYAAVFVQPASRITIHFEKEIPIDYNPNGRRTNHANFTNSATSGFGFTGLN